jgi:hypothetical protein
MWLEELLTEDIMTTPQLQQATHEVKDKYETWVLGSIKMTYGATKSFEEGSTPLAAFILISCAIDFLAGFMCGITSFQPRPGESSTNYKAFVTRYLTQYEPADVYTHIRCRLAHNYSIGGNVALTHLNPGAHDPRGTRGQKIINFEDFFTDFQGAASTYFNDLATDTTLQAEFVKRFPLGFADAATI